MSPQTARALQPGDHVAIRGTPDRRFFSHIGRVSKRTTKAVYAIFLPEPKRQVRFAYADKADMRALRRADVAETEGYKREAE